MCGRSAEEVRKKRGRSADEVRNAAEEVRTKCGTLRRKCGTAAEAAKKEEDERPCERHFFWLLAGYCPRAPRQREVNSRNTRKGRERRPPPERTPSSRTTIRTGPPRAACVARRRTRATPPPRVSLRTRRYTDARWRRGLTPTRGAQGKTETESNFARHTYPAGLLGCGGESPQAIHAPADRRTNAALRWSAWASASSRPPRFEEALCAATGRGSAPCLSRRRTRANERVVGTTRQR